MNNDLEVNLTEVAIDSTHCIGDPKKKKKKVRPIIVAEKKFFLRRNI